MLTYEDFAKLGNYLHLLAQQLAPQLAQQLAQQKCALLYSYVERIKKLR